MNKLWLLLGLTTLVLISCQKQTGVELLSDEKIAIGEDWYPTASLSVKNVSDRTSEVHLLTVGRIVGDKIECQFADFEPEKTAKWHPLPMKFFTLSDPQKKLNATVEKAISFSEIKKSSSLLEFVVKFQKDAVKFSSFWKVTPYLGIRDGKKVCSAKPEICLGTDRTACDKNWKWLKEIIAIPSISDYLLSGVETVTDLQGVFYEQVNGKFVESDPVSIL